MITKGMMTSNTPEWETPQWLFNEWNDRYNFVVDVCANRDNHKCDMWFDIEDDGLSLDWAKHSRVWMNPPYGREISKWVAKADDTAYHGGVVVALLPARTDTKWFHDYIYNRYDVIFLKGRLKFSNSKQSAPFPSMIVIFE